MSEEIIKENIITIIKYSRIPSLIKAQTKYRVNNPDIINKISNNWYHKNKDNEEFKERRRQYHLKYKQQKKQKEFEN